MEKQKRPPLPLDASPQEKYDNLILTIFEEWQRYVGDWIDFQDIFQRFPVKNLGFNSRSELLTFVEALEKNEFVASGEMIAYLNEEGRSYGYRKNKKITYLGLKYCLSLLESGKNSNKCFVAMAFTEDMERIYKEGILPAIETDNPFRAIRVDKEHTENEQTINDFIIASIKQSRFCVADLTCQRNGVYFEAGYALGRGLKVIYTCLREDHKNVHFDLKTMQTILYDTPEELREALSLKIQAFIIE